MNSNTGSDLGGCSAGGLKKKKKHRLWVNQFIKQYDCKYSSGEGKQRTEPKHMYGKTEEMLKLLYLN